MILIWLNLAQVSWNYLKKLTSWLQNVNVWKVLNGWVMAFLDDTRPTGLLNNLNLKLHGSNSLFTNLCNDVASLKMKLQSVICKKFDNLPQSTLKRKWQLMPLMKSNMRVKLPNCWLLASHDLVNLQVRQTILFSLLSPSTIQKKRLTAYTEENFNYKL